MKQWKAPASEQRMDNTEPRLKKQRRNGILRLKTWDGQAKNRDKHVFFLFFRGKIDPWTQNVHPPRLLYCTKNKNEREVRICR